MTDNRERLAWAIVLISFALCLTSAISLPLGVRAYLRNARTGLDILLEPQQGTPRMQPRGSGQVIALIGPTWDVPASTVITTDNVSEGLLTLYAPGPEPAAVAWIKLYRNTEALLIAARSPRFALSPLPHQVILEVRPPSAANGESDTEGRVRISVAPAGGRDTVAELHTPHLTAVLREGSYEVRVRAAFSELSVREGNAQVQSLGGSAITLESSQRTIAYNSTAPLEALPGERNLLRNGSFSQPLGEGWEVYSQGVQQGLAGTVTETSVAGRPAARFYRQGIGHAEVGIVQRIHYDVRDFTSLVLHLSVQVRGQSLPGCGSLGSECPIIVRLDYEDIYGTDRQWYYGFYSVEHVPPDLIQPWEELVPTGTWVTFDSGNLIEDLEAPPAVIQSVTIYASGHSFEALVTEVELLAQE